MLVVKSGLECAAYVVTDDIIINNLITKLAEIEKPLKFKTAIFTELTETKEWVKSLLRSKW